MMVQSTDGRLHHLQGAKLPDSISLYSGVPYTGAHLAEVLLSPKEAKGVPLLPRSTGFPSTRDGFFLVVGMCFFGVILSLVEVIVQSLT